MIPADAAISRFQRDLTVGSVLRGALLGGAALFALVGPVVGLGGFSAIGLAVVGGAWVLLSYRSLQSSRIAADAPALIAAGDFEAAEDRLDSALRGFSLFKTTKVLGLYHLAALRHAQRRWEEAALLCRAVVSQKLGAAQPVSNPARLMLADALLHVGDLRGAHAALLALYATRVTLNESLTLAKVQLVYLARTGQWQEMLRNVGAKILLAELMPTKNAASTQALLSLAAERAGRPDLARWLRHRAELLSEPATAEALATFSAVA